MSNMISQFYGMIILMPYQPSTVSKPYFEVVYENEVSKFEIQTGRMLEGKLPSDGQEIVQDWLVENRKEIHANWERLMQHKALKPVPPIL